MCHNEDLRDVTDDVCEMISEWTVFTEKLGHELLLGGITFNELTAISSYKLRRNAKVHKVNWLTQNVALKWLDITVAQMTSECKKSS
ncbi:11921_t:CDS:2 [Funneliformis geosporum]|uniref:11921_t:CDS:1 n=1 Tax=Funneliformis geosporum TaxID=1117311 RepID=A0A9W4SC51_9GLOM|nr:11921_t:CDS:2 [Funneliformis geosporum]